MLPAPTVVEDAAGRHDGAHGARDLRAGDLLPPQLVSVVLPHAAVILGAVSPVEISGVAIDVLAVSTFCLQLRVDGRLDAWHHLSQHFCGNRVCFGAESAMWMTPTFAFRNNCLFGALVQVFNMT